MAYRVLIADDSPVMRVFVRRVIDRKVVEPHDASAEIVRLSSGEGRAKSRRSAKRQAV